MSPTASPSAHTPQAPSIPPAGDRLPFAHLHAHSLYSDGTATPAKLVEIALARGFTALALTDHQTLDGHTAFVRAALCATPQPLSPILGIELRVYSIGGAGHVLVLPRSAKEYAALTELVRRRRRIYLNELTPCGVVTSACLGGEVGAAFKRGDYYAARDSALEFRRTLGDAYYLEAQPSFGAVMPWVFTLGRELHIPVIITNDVHYLDPESSAQHGAVGLDLASESVMRRMSPLDAYQKAMDTTGELAHLLSSWVAASSLATATASPAAASPATAS